MKQLTLILSLLVSSQVFAATQKADFKFKADFHGKEFKMTLTKANYSEGLQDFAQACFNNFAKGKIINHDDGIDLINACANPKMIN